MFIRSVLLPVLTRVGLVFVPLGKVPKGLDDALKKGRPARELETSEDDFPPIIGRGIVLRHTGVLFVGSGTLLVVSRARLFGCSAVAVGQVRRVMFRGVCLRTSLA